MFSLHLQAEVEQLQLIKNLNQFHPNVLYLAELNSGAVFLERSTLTYVFYNTDDLEKMSESMHPHDYSAAKDENITLRGHAYKVHLRGANIHARIDENGKFPEYYNYLLGADASKWAGHVPLFREVSYNEIYPGVAFKFYSEGQNPKYDFMVSAGADAAQIVLDFEGVDRLKIKDRNLEITTSAGTIIEQQPHAFQIVDGKKLVVACNYKLNSNTVSFEFPNGYSPQHELIIDPVIIASTYSGTTYRAYGHTATFDDAGNIYSGGKAFSPNANGSGAGYPVTAGAFQTVHRGGYQDICISKYNPDGSTLIWATYIGGNQQDTPHSLFANANQQLYILGSSNSSNYPTSANGYKKTNPPDNFSNVLYDIVVTKLSADGSVAIGSTYVGGRLESDGYNWTDVVRYYGDYYKGEIIVDANDNAYVASYGRSTDFPTTAGVIQPAYGGGYQDGVLFKLNSDLSTLVWSTFLGGPKEDACYGLKLDANGDLFVTGAVSSNILPNTAGTVNPNYLGGLYDGYIAHVSSNGQSMIRSTYFGSMLEEQSYRIDMDDTGNVYIFGASPNTLVMATPGAYQGVLNGSFIAKLKPTLDSILFITSFNELAPTAFMVDECGYIYAMGCGGLNVSAASLTGFQTTPDAFQFNSGGFYMLVLEPDASALRFGSYYGPADSHVDGGTCRFDKRGIIYHGLCTDKTNLFTTPNAYAPTNRSNDFDNCVFKIDFQPPRVEAAAEGTLAGTNDTSDYVEGCAPLTVHFINRSENATQYIWYFGNGDSSMLENPVYTYADTGLYDVMLIAMDVLACNEKDTAYMSVYVNKDSLLADFTYNILSSCAPYEVQVTSTGLGGQNFNWDFGDGATSTGQTATHIYANAGTFSIRLMLVDSASCNFSDTATQSITFYPTLTAQITPPAQTGCAPLDVSFTSIISGSANPVLFWDFGNGDTSVAPNPNYTYNTTGNYQVMLIATDSLTCNTADTAFATISVVNDTVTASFTFTETNQCDTLLVAFSSGSQGNYFWDFDDGTNSTLQNPAHVYSASGVYNPVLVVTDSATCNIADTFSAQITFTALPELEISIDDFSGCPPLEVQFQNTGTPAVTYLWDFGDSTNSASPSPTKIYSQTGSYTVMLIATDSATCNITDTTTGSVVVAEVPRADFDYAPEHPVAGTEVSFTNQSADATAYLWNFGDGDTSSIENPVHVFADLQQYIVCLTATASGGCTDSVCKALDLSAVFVADVPNAFSPNGDANNNVLYVKGQGVKELDFRVYNRWGELVFESHDMTKGWDGTYKNEPQEMEAYGYYLRAVFLNNEIVEKQGNVTLMR